MIAHFSRILIEFIPQSRQRYDTSGDWTIDGDALNIRITATPNPLHQQLVAVHELIEALLCNAAGVTQEAVDAFDMGPGADIDEPGDDPAAPYREQHQMATEIEMALACAMGVPWDEYDAAVGDHGLRGDE